MLDLLWTLTSFGFYSLLEVTDMVPLLAQCLDYGVGHISQAQPSDSGAPLGRWDLLTVSNVRCAGASLPNRSTPN